ncbi:hypothetical protein BKA69DRAFT_858990 [Paraphysoderma sedebokerense]|nr:hypothetical protein BKA69DRAFT_858990 [Paraphysoderma sedebokerense]
MSQRNSLKDRTLLIISSLLVVVEVALLSIVTAIDGPKPVTSVIKSSSIQYTTCVQLRPMEINWLVNVYNFVLLLFVLFLAFKTRSVVSRYRESQWIGYTVQNVCISIIVLFPIINSASSIITTFYIRTIFIFYATTVAYACLIGRTVFSIYTDGKKEQFSLSNGKLTTNHSKQTYQIEIPVKEAGSYFGTWRSHVLIFFKAKNLLALRDKRSDVHEPCSLYDVSAVKISKSDQVEKCIEFVTSKTTFLLQFPDKTAYDSWWDLLKVNALAVGSTTTGGSSGKNKSNP